MQLPIAITPASVNINEYTYLIYGRPKIGKTTFASKFPNALFIATEHGHKFVSVYRVNPTSWEDIKTLVGRLINEEHSYKTVVVDTADNLFIMCAKYICRGLGIDHQSDAEFGKAYDRIKLELMAFTNALTQHGLGVVFISHTEDREINEKITKADDEGHHVSYIEKVKKTDSTLSGTAKKVIHGLCDMIFYCYGDDEQKRWLRTKETTTIVAGDRSGMLPEVMPLDFDVFKQHLTEGSGEGGNSD